MKTAVLQDMTSCSFVDRYPEDSSRIFPSMVDTHSPGTRCHLLENVVFVVTTLKLSHFRGSELIMLT